MVWFAAGDPGCAVRVRRVCAGSPACPINHHIFILWGFMVSIG